jgi:hypothetical protein
MIDIVKPIPIGMIQEDSMPRQPRASKLARTIAHQFGAAENPDKSMAYTPMSLFVQARWIYTGGFMLIYGGFAAVGVLLPGAVLGLIILAILWSPEIGRTLR